MKKLLKDRLKTPDSPVARNLVAVDSPKKRMTVFELGSTGKSDRNARVMKKLENRLGRDPMILKDDGFEVLAEARVKRVSAGARSRTTWLSSAASWKSPW